MPFNELLDRVVERDCPGLLNSAIRDRALLAAIPEAIVIIDCDGQILEINATAERLLGHSACSAVGASAADLLVPAQLKLAAIKAFSEFIRGAGRTSTAFDGKTLHADGSMIPVEIRVARADLGGKAVMVATLRSCALRSEAERRFRDLDDSGIVGVVVTDTIGHVHEANETFLRMIGREQWEVETGRLRWTDITPPEWLPADAAAIQRLGSNGVAHCWEKEYLHKSGRRVPVLVGVAELEAGRCIAFVLDLTERKRLEAERAVATAELAGRDDALRKSEQQLLQAQKMESLGRVAGGVAHDFNNILSVILGYGEILSSEPDLPAHVREAIQQMHSAGERASALTRQLLAFSRQQVLAPRSTSASGTVHSMASMLRRLVCEDIELLFNLNASGRVFVDPIQLEQVIMNLVVNARDAILTKGKITIETRDVELDDGYASEHLETLPGLYVLLCVSDTGIGMARETQSRIFEPFFTTKAPGIGTGLGLATVFGIVKQSGGAVWVYSEPNQGSTFKVYLPRHDAPSCPAPTEPVLADHAQETVLLVEDDAQVRAVISLILTRHGYRVLEATCGEHALELFGGAREPIHLLLTDLIMPKLGGCELAERLRRTHPELKVIFMSGYTGASARHAGLIASAAYFVQKPIVTTELLKKMREALKSHVSSSQAVEEKPR